MSYYFSDMGLQKVFSPHTKKMAQKQSHMTQNLHIGPHIYVFLAYLATGPTKQMQTKCLGVIGILKVLLPPKPIRMFGHFAPK